MLLPMLFMMLNDRPADTPEPARVAVISKGKPVVLKEHLYPELPTVFVFYREKSSMEADLVESLKREAGERAGLRLIAVRTGEEPVMRENGISTTPTAVVLDRRGRETARTSSAEEISAAVAKAREVMRVDWPEKDDPRYKASLEILGRPQIAGILRTMTFNPLYMQRFNDLAQTAQFQDGFLKRRHKEMLGTYVSSLNKCRFCTGSHASMLQMAGLPLVDVDAIATGRVDRAQVVEKEKALLAYARILTLEPGKVKDSDIQRLRDVGWSDDEIAEAGYICAIFAFANRMANHFGLDYPAGRWLPPDLREKSPAAGNK
jgi:uncharacterized peroxidase-related enzyme